MKAIDTELLTKYYGSKRGIADVSLSVDKGDFFGFIGPNGAGKSTTIRTLLGLISPTSGRASVLGNDIIKDKTKIAASVGYMPSESAFYNGMKVRDILAFCAKMRGLDCKGEAKKLCERLELDMSRRVNELSFGNRKKVSIVCALQHNPELYILDEPTSGLDPLMQREFFDILKERNQNGATVFLSSHVLSEVAKYCKSAAVIRDGGILVSDKVDSLGHTGVKRVSLRTSSALPKIAGIKDLKTENENTNFLYSGDIKALISELDRISFEDINITDPDLEEVFMHYYAKEDN
ncbi:MAG: ABC transporter ATP-binding protein [Clostridia bacterium]|nr:ABC transporter ATP-binding protein [Clostridia bacterium]